MFLYLFKWLLQYLFSYYITAWLAHFSRGEKSHFVDVSGHHSGKGRTYILGPASPLAGGCVSLDESLKQDIENELALSFSNFRHTEMETELRYQEVGWAQIGL